MYSEKIVSIQLDKKFFEVLEKVVDEVNRKYNYPCIGVSDLILYLMAESLGANGTTDVKVEFFRGKRVIAEKHYGNVCYEAFIDATELLDKELGEDIE